MINSDVKTVIPYGGWGEGRKSCAWKGAPRVSQPDHVLSCLEGDLPMFSS